MKLEIQLLLLIGVLLTPFVVADDEIKETEHCIARADIVVVVDKSGSISGQDFSQIVAFLGWLSEFTHISEDGNHLGVVSFGDTSEANIGLKDYYDYNSFNNSLKEKVTQGADDKLTNHYAGFSAANDMLTGSDARPDAKKLIIFLTDGENNEAPNNDPQAANRLVKSMKEDLPLLDIFVIKAEEEFEAENSALLSRNYATEPGLAKYIASFGGITNEEFLDGLTFVFCKLVTLRLNIDASVSEDKGTNHEVTDIEDFDLTEPIYTLINVPNTVIPFRVISDSGKIFVNAALDYEVQKLYWFQIQLTDGKDSLFSETINVTINVLDVNDNSPIFDNTNVYEVDIYETQAFNPPSFVHTLLANDADSGAFGTVTYSVVNGNKYQGQEKFNIDSISGVVSLVGQVNKKEKPRYTINIKAEDGGSPSRSATETLIVNILTRNLNKPIFQATPYIFSIYEDKTGTLASVQATDEDEGDVIAYRIEDQAMFNINSVSGEITLKAGRTIDYEALSVFSFTFKVYATSNDDEAVQDVTITIKDANDNTPTFSYSSYTGELTENSAQNVAVSFTTPITATDGDITAVNNVISYQITQGNIGGRFKVIKNSNGDPVIRLETTPLNREEYSTYTLTLRAKDNGIYPGQLDSTTQVVINVLDVDDVAPVFTPNTYSETINENFGVGGTVLSTIVTDSDTVASNLVYSILNGAGLPFTINSQGQLIAQTGIDYESTQSHMFTIQVMDDGMQVDTAVVTITITDYNDNAPAITTTLRSQSIPETVTKGYSVITFTGEDGDGTAPNNEFMFSLQPGNGNRFTITSNGELKVNQNNLQVGSYEITVIITDKGNPTLSSKITYTINVEHVNSAPILARQNMEASVTDGTPAGEPLFPVIAFDDDNDILTYTVTDPGSKFSFRSDGYLVLNEEVEADPNIAMYDLINIQVQDPSGATAIGTIKLTIDDVNDRSPLFAADAKRSITLTEKEYLNYLVSPYTAQDSDRDASNNVVTYSVSGGSGLFSMTQSGELKLSGRLDRETKKTYNLVIQARDNGSPSRTTTFSVTVNVGDANDNKPIFDAVSYSGNVNENSDAGTMIHEGASTTGTSFITVKATDSDDTSPNNQITYAITNGQANNEFAISASGKITVSGDLDREYKGIYKLTVTATDGDSTTTDRNSASVQVEITINDVNDNTPIITSGNTKTLPENQALESFHTITATDEDAGNNGMIMYSIISGNTDNMGNIVFSIKNDDQLTLEKNLDFDEGKKIFTLVIRATDKGDPAKYSEQTFTVKVTDVNDNAPIFGSTSYSNTVSENLEKESPVITVSATDKDSTTNGMIEYTIESANALFELNTQSGEVTLKSKLDYEVSKIHTFYVVATDKGNPAKSSRVMVTINVSNENEHAPKISNQPISGSVDENSAADVQIVTIAASDGDGDVLIYSIVSADGISNFFKIDQQGLISTSGNPKIDFEANPSFMLPIKVSDGTNEATTTVTITVNNLNEYSPVFNPATYVKTISENVESGFAIISVTATDEDEPNRSDPVVYEIIENSCDTNDFTISNNGDITTNGQLVPSTCTLKVKATDKAPGLVRRSTTVDVTITVNENVKPNLGNDMVTYVDENRATGTVTTITASDTDGPQSVRYSIVGGNEFFKIDASSGSVTIKKPTNFEVTPSYILTIRARDGKSFSEKKLTINVNDLNEAPEFGKETYTAFVNEKASVETDVTQASATDEDDADIPNGQLEYSITSGNDEKLFKIDAMGNIKTAELLPTFQPNQKYTLEIKVSDGGDPALMDTATVTINVNNENDAPVITSPINVCVNEEQEPKYNVVKVSATDADNDKLTYSLEGTALFTIDESGQIEGRSKLDRDDGATSYTFQVKVYDGSVTVSADVKVCLTDINDNEPKITSAGSVTVSEDQETDKKIFDFKASDSDSGMNAQTMFSIIDGNADDTFMLTTEGYLSFKTKPDYETKKEYVLTIKVEDKGTTPLMTTKQFTVKVTDVNDNDPIFSPAEYTKTINEDHTKDTSVLQVIATDADSTTNGMIVYSIESATDGSNDKFYIKADGLILLKNEVDYETQKIYMFYVRATDKGSPQRSSRVNVTININNRNEHAPVLQNVKGVFIEEEKIKGREVTTIDATDADGDPLKFSIIDPTGNTFTIDEDTGVITTIRSIDFETHKSFTVTVIVSDGQYSDQAEFTISVTNINDNSPIFSETSYSKVISENNNIGYPVITVIATDKDDENNPNPVKYVIEKNCNYDNDGIDDYSINENSGEIKVNDDLDASQSSECILIIKATDKSPGNDDDRKSSTVEVKITIVDNVAPVIGPDMFVNINENVATGIVTKITATDADGPDDELEYSIVVGESSFFKIGKSTGIVTILKATNFEVTKSYSLTIRASDARGAYSDKKLIINVNDVNEAPVFAENSRIVTVAENVDVRHTIGTFTANDVDVADINKLVYTISAGDMNTFGIDSQSGVLFNKVLIDYETSQKSYTLTITVTDVGQLTDTMEVIVNLDDVNEKPTISSEPIDKCVDEEITPLSTVIATIEASDPETNGLQYSTSLDTVFVINSIGEIRNTARLDREDRGTYEFTVIVSDGQLSVSQTVKICLNDINDNTPEIAAVDDVEILVGSEENTPIATIVASDRDIGDNKRIMYTITSGNINEAFKIDMISGEVKLNKDMATRMPSVYTLTVTATDKGTPSRFSSITFKVTIKAKPVIGCNCELPEDALPCLQWTKYEIIKSFTGNCYVDKLKKAITAIREKIDKLGELRVKFMTCANNLRSFILSPANAAKADDYFDRLDICSVNTKCKIDHWKMMLTQKEENLKMELKNEEEGWSSYDLPGYGFFNYIKNTMSQSQSSRTL